MPQNLELKAYLSNYEDTLRRAKQLTETAAETVVQSDTYYNVPVGRLKLREVQNKQAELIWYDRDESSPHRLSMYEKVEVSPDTSFLRLLPDELGTSSIVKKSRSIFYWNNCRIHLDIVEQLGHFIEFEVMLDGQDDGKERMIFLKDYFQIKEENIVLESYSDLLTK